MSTIFYRRANTKWKIKFSVVFILIWFCSYKLLCQSSKIIDSLVQVLEIADNDTSRITIMNQLAWSLQNLGDYTPAREYTHSAIHLSEKLLAEAKSEDDKNNVLQLKAAAVNNIAMIQMGLGAYDSSLKNLVTSYKIYRQAENADELATIVNNIGMLLKKQGKYQASLQYYLLSLKVKEILLEKAKKSNDQKKIKKLRSSVGGTLGNIGNIYRSLGNYPEALTCNFKFLKIAEETGNQKHIANALASIGNIFAAQDNFSESLKYLFSSLKIKEKIGDKKGICDTHNNIGVTYMYMKDYDQALIHYTKAYEMRKKSSDKDGIASSLNNLGIICEATNKHSDALEYHWESLSINTELGDSSGMAHSFYNIGGTYYYLKKFKKAKEFTLKALQINNNLGVLEGLRDSYENLARIDSSMGNYLSALQSYRLFIQYRDSIINDENTKKSVEEQMLYEFDKIETKKKAEQEKKDAIAEEERRKQKMILLVTAIGLGLVLAFSIFVLKNYRQKKKANIEISLQKAVIEEKQKEILDSIHYAGRIQRALITNEKYIERKLNNLKK